MICDPERVAQLLRILIDNALDPHRRRAPTVVVTVDAPPNGDGARAVGPRQRARASPTRRSSASSSPSTAPTARAAPASAWRSRTSSRCSMGAALEVASAPGDTTFTLTLAAGEA